MIQKPFGGNLTSFLVGLVIGILGSFAAFSGRVASLETIAAQHTKQLDNVQSEISKLSDLVVTALRK